MRSRLSGTSIYGLVRGIRANLVYGRTHYSSGDTCPRSEDRSRLAHLKFRFIRSCSAALPPHLMAKMEAAFGVPLIEAYGMTEASASNCDESVAARHAQTRIGWSGFGL